jgi:hypothetical protein
MKRILLTTIVLLGLLATAPAVWAQAPDDNDREIDRPRRPMLDRWREAGGRDGWRHMSPAKTLSDEEIQALLPIVREAMPELGARLEKMGKEHPERLRAFLSRVAPRLQEMQRLKKDDPQEYQRRVAEAHGRLKVARALKSYHEAVHEGDTAAAEKRKAELRQMLSESFTARQQRMEEELKRMEQRLAKLRVEMRQRFADRDKLIDQRLQELLDGRIGHGERHGMRGEGFKRDGSGDRSPRDRFKQFRDRSLDRDRRAPAPDDQDAPPPPPPPPTED